MTRWLVDGMNVIGSRPDGWWRDRRRAMAQLVADLDSWAATAGDPATVVFDGDPPDEPPGGGIAVVYAGRERTADDVIAALVAADPDPGTLVVVTSDAELVRRVQAHGAQVLGAGGFRRRLESVAR